MIILGLSYDVFYLFESNIELYFLYLRFYFYLLRVIFRIFELIFVFNEGLML